MSQSSGVMAGSGQADGEPLLVVPTLPAWVNGHNLEAWCAVDRRWHVHDLKLDMVEGDVYPSLTCRWSRVGLYRLAWQAGPQLQPHRDRRGRWWRIVPSTGQLTRKGASEPERLAPSPLPASLAADAHAVEPVEHVLFCDEGCGPVARYCEECGAPGCPTCSSRCPECGAEWPHTCRSDGYDPACGACRSTRAAEVAQWEQEPLDPEDDLALIADEPGEVERIRALQAAVKRHPVYVIVDRIGGDLRRRLLAEIDAGRNIEFDAEAEEFYAAEVCRCELRGDREFLDGSPVYSWHREAARCARCLAKEGLEEEAHEQLLAEVFGGYRGSSRGSVVA